MSRLSTAIALLLALIALSLPSTAHAQSAVLFKNVKVFDGKADELSLATSVLVVGNKISKIGGGVTAPEKALVIDGGGRTLMPGLIDAHWHTMLAVVSPETAITADVGYTNLVAGREAQATLLRGFTTVRDLGGPAFGLKRAIDEGVVVGPRIFPCGAMISITSGHGDFRQKFELPRAAGDLSRIEQIGGAMIADSPDEVRRRTREQLMLGATQIKLTAGGGVASPHSPIDVSTFTLEELRAAVEAAENWGTYLTVHAYTPAAMQRAMEAGVRCIEHGHLMDEATAKQMAEKGIWLSIQPFLDDEDLPPFPEGSSQRAKLMEVVGGTDRAYRLAKTHKIKTAWGTDILFSPVLAKRQGAQLVKLANWYSLPEILQMATSDNAELLALCGKRNPYPGKLGVIKADAFADLLLVDGNPLDDLKLIADPEKNFVVIMKDGKIYKNTLR